MFHVSSAGCSLLVAEGFSCSLGVLNERLGISKLHFFLSKKYTFFPAVKLLQFLVIKILDPDPDP
jgi:hypothetical protein